MTFIIIGFGIAIALAGIAIMVNPEWVLGYMRSNAESPSLHILTVVIRVILGLLLVAAAGASRYPLVIEVLGWLSIIAALIMASMGRHNFTKIIFWALEFSKKFGRISGGFAFLFGAFLTYAFL